MTSRYHADGFYMLETFESEIQIYIYIIKKAVGIVMSRDLAAFFAQGVFVKQVFCQAVLRSSHTA